MVANCFISGAARFAFVFLLAFAGGDQSRSKFIPHRRVDMVPSCHIYPGGFL
jgi:hypothetical protein